MMAEPVTVGAADIALGDFFLQRLPTEITPSSIGFAEIYPLLTTDMVELHYLGWEANPAVRARSIKGSVQNGPDLLSTFLLVLDRLAAFLLDPVWTRVVIPVVGSTSRLLLRTQISVGLCHAWI